MLFRREFHEGLRRGAITLSFRTWRTARARVGGRHRFGAGDELEVLAVERVRAGEIGEADARRAGFDDRAALMQFLERAASALIRPGTSLFRVTLRYAGRRRAPTPDRREPSASELHVLAAKLDAMERRSPEPWAWATLGRIAREPRVRAAQLARTFGRETAPFKADVRKLKRLGLTLSHEVGYEVTPAGRALLRVYKSRGGR